jgi:type VI secretion system protein ImpA
MADPKATEPVIDIPALLEPIPGDNPCGENLRIDPPDNSPWYVLRRLQKDARTLEQQAAMNAALSDGASDSAAEQAAVAAWGTLLDLCEKTTKETTKDVLIASWIVESLVRIHGFAGLRDGFTFAADLVEKYWDNLNYDTEDEESGAKAQPFAGLNGTEREGALIRPFKAVALTPVGENGAFGLGKCQQLQESGGFGEAEALARTGGTAFYQPLMADLKGAHEAYDRLTDLFNDKMGSDSPGSSQIKDVFEAAESMVRTLAGQFLSEGDASTDGATSAPGGASGGGGGGEAGGAMVARPGVFATREQALEMLNAVAKFFREREPHSPISYALDTMVERARMPLFELLAELLPDDDARKRVLQNAGIRPPKPPDY